MLKVSLYIRAHGTRKLTPAKPFNHPLGTIYVLRYAGKWETLPNNLSFPEAKAAAMRKEIDLFTGEQTLPPPVPLPAKTEAQSLDRAIDTYRKNLLHKAARTQLAYGASLKKFLQSTGDKALAQICKQDLQNFETHLRAHGMGDRTVSSRMTHVITFLREQNIKDLTLRIKYVQQKVRAYRKDELKAIFASCDSEEWLLFQFFLCSGFREQEVMNATKEDIDFPDGLITVRAKEGWKPKHYEEREVSQLAYTTFMLVSFVAEVQGLWRRECC